MRPMNSKNGKGPEYLDNPFAEEDFIDSNEEELENLDISNFPTVEKGGVNLADMSSHAEVSGSALRVELRRCYDPATGKTKPQGKLVGKEYLIGLLGEKDLPEVGKVFQLSYHNHNGLSDFGHIHSEAIVETVVTWDNFFYFVADEAAWRLEVLNTGN